MIIVDIEEERVLIIESYSSIFNIATTRIL